MSGIIQYYTNNDGNLGSAGAMGFQVPPQILKQLEKNMSGVSTEPVDLTAGSSGVDTGSIDSGGTSPVVEEVEQRVFMSRSGNYYKAAFRQHPSDNLIPFPSPDIEAHLAQDASGNSIPTNADVVRESFMSQAGAEGTLYDPLLTYKQNELRAQDQMNQVREEQLASETAAASQQTSSPEASAVSQEEGSIPDGTGTASTPEAPTNNPEAGIPAETGTDPGSSEAPSAPATPPVENTGTTEPNPTPPADGGTPGTTTGF